MRIRLVLAVLLLAPLLLAAKPYAVNPTLGASGSPTVDGANSGEWSDANVIALDAANDDPRSLGDNWCFHETPWDITHLWAAWDNDNLYLAWQYVDVTDIIDPNNAGSAGGTKPNQMNLIQWIVLDTIPNAGAELDMWGKNGGSPYWTGADLPEVQLYVASNLWQAYVSRAKDGVFPVDDGGVDYFAIADAGIEVKVSNTLAATELWGPDDADDADNPTGFTDFASRGHQGSRDTFYEMKIPLSFLRLTRAQLESNGLGVMLGQGEQSCMDTIPNDPATSDLPGTSPSNSPLEWGDIDALSVAFARVGHAKGSSPDPCLGISCGPGNHCLNGACVPDAVPDEAPQDVADSQPDVPPVDQAEQPVETTEELPVEQTDVASEVGDDHSVSPEAELEGSDLLHYGGDDADEGCGCELARPAPLPLLGGLGLMAGLALLFVARRRG